MKNSMLPRLLLLAGALLCLAGCGRQEPADASPSKDTPLTLTGDPYPYDLSEYLELREYRGISYVPYGNSDDTAIAYGDTVTVEIEGVVDGIEEPITGIDTFEVGHSNFLDGFDEGLVGHDLNDTIVMELKFPEDHQNSAYAGKDVKLTAYVLILDRSAYRDMNEAALWSIVTDESVVLRYPEAELERCVNDFRTVYTSFARQYNMELDEYLRSFFDSSESELDELCLENARELVKEDMILYAIFRDAGLQITQADLDLCKPVWLTTYGYESEADMPVGWEDPGVAASLEKIAVERVVKAYIYSQAVSIK